MAKLLFCELALRRVVFGFIINKMEVWNKTCLSFIILISEIRAAWVLWFWYLKCICSSLHFLWLILKAAACQISYSHSPLQLSSYQALLFDPLFMSSLSPFPFFQRPITRPPSALSVYLYNKIFSQLTLSLLFRHQKYWKQGWKGESREESWPHKMELNLAAAASTRPLISWLHSFLTLLTSWHDRNVYLALLWRPGNGRRMLGK